MKHLAINTPVGDMLIASDGLAITEVRFLVDKYLPAAEKFEQHFGVHDPHHALLQECQNQLCAYFKGSLTHFKLPLSPKGTAFQQSVWQTILTVGHGQSKTYGQLAHLLHKPKAMRAVGGATGRNPIAIIIPCHRILGQSSAITGYASGLTIKRHLLALENIKYHE